MAFGKNWSFLLLFLVIFLAAAASATSERATTKQNRMSISQKHENWMARHGRVYASKQERDARFNIFKHNLKFITDFNRRANQTYKLGINKFADMTSHEFKARYVPGFKEPVSHVQESSSMSPFMYENVTVADLPPSMDWRTMGAVTPVKSQGQCGACWAFAATAAMEGIIKIRTGELISLSEQHLLDCIPNPDDRCAIGNYPNNAFSFVAQRGIAAESNYPYIEQHANETYGRYGEACHVAAPAAVITTYEKVPPYDEVSLLKAVTYQPVTILINGITPSMRFYKSGIITSDANCDPIPNHAVTIVGYGTSRWGTKYWLVKNSWGKSWGEKGYFRLQRDSGLVEGVCGLAAFPSYPVIRGGFRVDPSLAAAPSGYSPSFLLFFLLFCCFFLVF